MAGENIEDISIDLLKASDSEVKHQCLFPEPGLSEAEDRKLKDSITEQAL